MEDLGLAIKTLNTAADALDGAWLLLRIVPDCLDPIPNTVTESKAKMSPEADALRAATLASEEITKVSKMLRRAAKNKTQSVETR
jgi:hypothetical protein